MRPFGDLTRTGQRRRLARLAAGVLESGYINLRRPGLERFLADHAGRVRAWMRMPG